VSGERREREFLTIDELSEYLNLKRSTLYSLVESGELPHYRVGRLVRFKRDDIDQWMEAHRKEAIDTKKRAIGILKAVRPTIDVDRLVKKSIEESKNFKYIPGNGKPDQSRSLRKGVSDGAL
jgi:excisionase family DNA binding protein